MDLPPQTTAAPTTPRATAAPKPSIANMRLILQHCLLLLEQIIAADRRYAAQTRSCRFEPSSRGTGTTIHGIPLSQAVKLQTEQG